MEDIYDLLYNILTLVILLISVYIIIFKYISGVTLLELLKNFEKKWKKSIHSLYFRTYYDQKNEELVTNYHLNNGLYADLQKAVKFPKI
tara:strand:+ start:623 stop:889 length:267 start_codon:yes stop_codon:yes gene_type:complete